MVDYPPLIAKSATKVAEYTPLQRPCMKTPAVKVNKCSADNESCGVVLQVTPVKPQEVRSNHPDICDDSPKSFTPLIQKDTRHGGEQDSANMMGNLTPLCHNFTPQK